MSDFAERHCARCGASATVIAPGSAPVIEAGIMLRGPIADLEVCLDCAIAIGWPWKSERKGRKRNVASDGDRGCEQGLDRRPPSASSPTRALEADAS